MMTTKLGTIKREEIRKIWKEEPQFSAWLAEPENIKLLSEAVGVDILPEETEADVGKYRADIVAIEDGTDRRIIIENQYSVTNHDHLGKIITYAAGKEAKVLIWIVEKAEDEHRAAVEWLNDHTDEDIGIFLVQIEIFRIGDSAPAPYFTVLERPNDWTKQNKHPGISQLGQVQVRFWDAFMDAAMADPAFSKLFKRHKGQAQNWFNLPLGSADYYISLTAKTAGRIGVELYIPKKKEIFKNLLPKRQEIETALGLELDWQELPEKSASRVLIERDGDYTSEGNWPEFFKWYAEKAIAFKKILPDYLKQAKQ